MAAATPKEKYVFLDCLSDITFQTPELTETFHFRIRTNDWENVSICLKKWKARTNVTSPVIGKLLRNYLVPNHIAVKGI